MNILIDTNILIQLEDTNCQLDESFADIRRLSSMLGHKLLVHPAQKEDIGRDRNEQRKNIVLSRISLYQAIPSPPVLSDHDLENYGWNQAKDNDRIDNLLLHALARGACHLLVTNDRGIHKKAARSNLQEKVHRHDQFLVFLRAQLGKTSLPPCGIKEKYLHEFDVNQPFFDSLRNGYDKFNDWYLSKSADQRKAWCLADPNNKLHALCIYKKEESPVITDNGLPLEGKALKLCTFKVGESMRGRKIGERLLYTAFKKAREQRCKWVYLHAYGAEHELLVALCLDYGFQRAGIYNGRDEVYLKSMVPNNSLELNPLDYAKYFYPNFRDDNGVKKFLVPIKRKYHEDLFPDISEFSDCLLKDDPVFHSPQSNTIKKAYICHANTLQISSGDILLFYRTEDRQSIECIGVVEQALRSSSYEEVAPMVSKRTVYGPEELKSMLEKEALIILFRLMTYFSPVSYDDLLTIGVKGPIQCIRELPHNLYKEIRRDS
jgi:GNAT superfamily N-acetyltransferase/rRNA-processing protein FCF1